MQRLPFVLNKNSTTKSSEGRAQILQFRHSKRLIYDGIDRPFVRHRIALPPEELAQRSAKILYLGDGDQVKCALECARFAVWWPDAKWVCMLIVVYLILPSPHAVVFQTSTTSEVVPAVRARIEQRFLHQGPCLRHCEVCEALSSSNAPRYTPCTPCTCTLYDFPARLRQGFPDTRTCCMLKGLVVWCGGSPAGSFEIPGKPLSVV